MTQNQSYSISAYAKAGTANQLIMDSGGNGYSYAIFNITATVNSIVSGGAGYQVGDVLTVIPWVHTVSQPTQLTVSSVNSGVITGVTVSLIGSYVINPSLVSSNYYVSGGNGTGAQFNMTLPAIYSAAGWVAPRMDYVGNGWFRCSSTLICSAATGSQTCIFGAGQNQALNYAGTGKILYINGIQISNHYSVAPYGMKPASSNSAGYATMRMSGNTNASHTAKITLAAAGTANLTLMGIEANICNSSQVKVGASLHGVGSAGAQVLTYTALNAENWERALQALHPNTVGIMFGVNELTAATSPATQTANIATLISWVQSACPYADILLITPTDIAQAGTYAPMANYAASQYALAFANKYAYINLGKECGLFASDNNRGFEGDYKHPSWIGAQQIADAIYSFVTRGN